MNDYVLITDSSCDLPAELAEKLDVVVLPLSVTVGNDTYKNYLDGREIAFKDFYARVRGGENAVTSAVNMEAFMETFRPYLEKGIDILYLGFSSGLSGTVNAGAMAAQELGEEFPDRKIYVVDTKCASMGQGLCVYYAALEKQAALHTLVYGGGPLLPQARRQSFRRNSHRGLHAEYKAGAPRGR